MVDLPTWPEQPLDESPGQFSGVYPWLEALANWGGLGLPWRGGIGNPIVQRSVGPAKHIQALDDLMRYLATKLGTKTFTGDRPVRLRPGQSTMKTTAEAINDFDWSGQPVHIKVRPDVLGPEQRTEGAKTILHELFHPKMTDVAARRPDLVEALGRASADRLDTILPEIPLPQLKTFSNNLNRGYYSGPDLWEELAVRLMEHNVGKRRLGP